MNPNFQYSVIRASVENNVVDSLIKHKLCAQGEISERRLYTAAIHVAGIELMTLC